MKTSLFATLILALSAAPAMAGENVYLGKDCYGFFSLDVEHLAARSASADLFKGNPVRNIYAQLFTHFPKMNAWMKENQYEPVLDFFSQVQEFQLMFIFDKESKEFRRGVCAYVRGKASKEGFHQWTAAMGPKLGFETLLTKVEGQDVYALKAGDRDGPAIAFVEDGVLIGSESSIGNILKNKGKEIPAALNDAFKARAGKVAAMSMSMPDENGSMAGNAWIEGGKIKGKLTLEMPKRENDRFAKDLADFNKTIAQFKCFQGISITYETGGEGKGTLTGELDDAKIKDYLKMLMVPQLEAKHLAAVPEPKFITLPSQSISNLIPDAGGNNLAVLQYGTWGDNPKPGAYHIIDLDAGKIASSTTCKYNENDKISQTPSTFALHTKADRFFLSTYNNFRNSSAPGTNDLCELKSRKAIKAIQGINQCAFSPDGKILASMGYQGLQLYDAADGDSIITIQNDEQNSYYESSKWSKDSQFFAASSNRYSKDPHLAIYDIKEKTRVGTVKLAEDSVDCFDWLGSDKLAIVTRKKNQLLIWDVKQDKAAKTVDLPPAFAGMVRACQVQDAETVLLQSGAGVYTLFHLDKGIVKQVLDPLPEVDRGGAICGGDRIASLIPGTLVVWKWK